MIKDVPVQRLTERRKTSEKGEYQLCNTLEKTIMDCKLTMQPIEQLRLTSVVP